MDRLTGCQGTSGREPTCPQLPAALLPVDGIRRLCKYQVLWTGTGFGRVVAVVVGTVRQSPGMDVTALLLLVIGLAVGSLLGALAQRARWAADVASARAESRAARERQAESERAGDRTQQQLAERFRALSSEALERTSEQLLQLADT